ncbi:MAG: hypothetical protein ACI97B_003607 [Verrucomicrobiales bacterium]|jgi:hypothetical protein
MWLTMPFQDQNIATRFDIGVEELVQIRVRCTQHSVQSFHIAAVAQQVFNYSLTRLPLEP